MRVVALGLLGLFGAVLLWALLGKVIPNLVPDGERIARLREPLDYWNALALVGAMTLPLALWAAVRREHPLAPARGLGGRRFAAVVVVLLTYSRGGVVVALLAPAAYIALTRKRVEAAAALVVASFRPPCSVSGRSSSPVSSRTASPTTSGCARGSGSRSASCLPVPLWRGSRISE